MEECDHCTTMTMFTAKVNRGIIPEPKKMVRSKIKLGLPLMVPDLKHKFQMIYVRGTKVIEWKQYGGHIESFKTSCYLSECLRKGHKNNLPLY